MDNETIIQTNRQLSSQRMSARWAIGFHPCVPPFNTKSRGICMLADPMGSAPQTAKQRPGFDKTVFMDLYMMDNKER
jgi:hypothetical protein